MAALVPHPFGRLVRRMLAELERERAIFDLPERRFVLGTGDLDCSVTFHGKTASAPLGPAAGPHSQLAQNLVLAFLGGGRIFELKTVQILDDLEIPRPCIDMQTVGYNVEWSQELRLEQSLEEYVKAALLVKLLVASGELALEPGFDRVVYDMSVGYDLAGIRSERVQAFLDGMLDASGTIEKLRRQIPDEHAALRDVDLDPRIADTLTLSTFHGCPPDEIEKILDWLLREKRLHCVVKLNPTLLGPKRARELLNDVLGYEARIPDWAFEKDTQWQQAVDFVGRLGDTARSLGLGFGVKLTNTLIVENHRDFFPRKEEVMYLSGQPLHVLAMSLVARFRETFGDRVPISFSAGIDSESFADAVSLGLVPVTVCSDLLRTGGYGRMQGYFEKLRARMKAAGARDVEEWILHGQGRAAEALDRLDLDGETRERCRRALESRGDLRAAAGTDAFARWVGEAKLLNTRAYVERIERDPRFTRAGTGKKPKKVGSALELFDCLTCDKCIPVCPNDANFAYPLPQQDIPVVKARRSEGGGWRIEAGEPLRVEKKHQIANYADFCNECGNCDVFCPEDGGPYAVKPRFFGSREQWAAHPDRDGFYLERGPGGDLVLGRFSGKEVELRLDGGRASLRGEGFDVRFDAADPGATLEGSATGVVDLTCFFIMDRLRAALLDGGRISYVGA